MTYANIVASQKVSSAIVEIQTKGILGRVPAGGEIPQSSTQKKWTCALCLVKSSKDGKERETSINSSNDGKGRRGINTPHIRCTE
jgi:hypothetical protein